MSWKPSSPFVTPLKILEGTTVKEAGVSKKVYAEDGPLFLASVKSYGGTERESNGAIVIEDTAIIETHFRPDISAEHGILDPVTGQVYEILGTPENIEMRGQYLRFKVRALKGGA